MKNNLLKYFIFFIALIALLSTCFAASKELPELEPISPPIVKPSAIPKPNVNTYVPTDVQTQKQLSSSPVGDAVSVKHSGNAIIPNISRTTASERQALSTNNYNSSNSQITRDEYLAQKRAMEAADFGSYMREVQRKIKSNWNPPKSNVPKKVLILFKVGKNGQLLSSKIIESSGDDSVDAAAMRALKKSAPFRPLPETFKGDSVSIQFTFDYKVITRTQSPRTASKPKVQTEVDKPNVPDVSGYQKRLKLINENENYKKDISKYKNTVRILGITSALLGLLTLVLGCLLGIFLYRRYSANSLSKDTVVTKIEEVVEEETGKIIYTERTVDLYEMPRNIVIEERRDYFWLWLVGIVIMIVVALVLYLRLSGRM